MSLSRTAYFANGFAVGGMMSITCAYCGAIACYGQELGHRYGCPELKKIGCVYAQTVTTPKDLYSKSEVKIKTTRYITEEEFEKLRRRNAELEAENERLRNALEEIENTWPLDGENASLMAETARAALEVDGGKATP